jgi:hypothetical protein
MVQHNLTGDGWEGNKKKDLEGDPYKLGNIENTVKRKEIESNEVKIDANFRNKGIDTGNTCTKLNRTGQSN